KKPGNDHADDDRERRHDQPVPQFAQMLEKGHRAIGWYRRRLEPLQTEMDRPALDRQRHGSLGKGLRRRCVGRCQRDPGWHVAAAESWRRSGVATGYWPAAVAGIRSEPAHLSSVPGWVAAAGPPQTEDPWSLP